MPSQPARRLLLSLLTIITLLFGVLGNPHLAAAQTPTPTGTGGLQIGTTTTAQWEFDPEVTEVGRNADRARQLLWWVFSHPGIHSAGILTQMWAVSRNIVYVFIVLVIVAFGLSLILARRNNTIGPIFSGITSPVFGLNIPSVFLKIAGYLLYVTFSYIVIIGLIQLSDVTMRFFIENVGGRDLFNVIFAGAGNSEANYVTFEGYRDTSLIQREMVNTSLFLIRVTSMSYFAMAVIIILRTVILWFLLIIAPFLALLMPFVFIRNVGWIWIGVFFQWLFYGPMMALFLAALTRIWVSGIPFPFDFSRVNTPGGQIYRTSINILYGGPAQTLSPGNSANYIDTYAEYVIALIMLWAAIILPWLLLRIFRDYCCAGIASAGATLASIFDRMRQFPVPPTPGPTLPSGTTVRAVDLPFRQRIEEKVREVTRTSVSQMQKTRIEDIKHVSQTSTQELARAMNISVNRLSDVSRMELNTAERSKVQENLRKVTSAERLSVPSERSHFETIKSELQSRATAGDRTAQTILMAGENKIEELAKEVVTVGERRVVAAPMFTQAMFAPSREVSRQGYFQEITRELNVAQVAPKVAVTVNIPEETVKQVLQQVSTSQVYSPSQEQSIARQTNLTTSQVQHIVSAAHAETQSQSQKQFTNTVAQEVKMPEATVKAVLSRIPVVGTIPASLTTTIAQEFALDESQVNRIVTVAQNTYTKITTTAIANEIAQTTGVSETKVKEVLTKLPASGEITANVVVKIAQETGVTESKVETIANKHKEIKEKTAAPMQALTRELTQTTGVSETKVKEVIERLSKEERVTAAVVSNIAQETGVTEAKVETIANKHKEMKTVSAAGGQPTAAPAVTLDDYEEVRQMWINHYRESPVPVTESVKTREMWVVSEQKKLQNIVDLLGSRDPQLKQKGLSEVAEILPFMLLGGFSDSEVATYVKAKLEASKAIAAELEMEKKVSEKVKKQMEEEKEETMVEVPERKKEAEAPSVKQEQKMDIPKEDKKTN